MNIKLDEQYTINCDECGYQTKCISITPDKLHFIKLNLCEDCLKIMTDAINAYYKDLAKTTCELQENKTSYKAATRK